MRQSRAFLKELAAEWAFPVRTLVGVGARRNIPSLIGQGGAPLVVTDPGLAKLDWFGELLDGLRASGLRPIPFTSVHPNPLDTDVQEGAALYRREGATGVVCVGGGSALDAGKCVAMTARSGLSLAECDYFADSPALPPGGELVPCVAVPTTSGTGAEMDSGSMYTDTGALVKRCAGHTGLPLTAVLDPELTVGLPANLTAWTGMDATVHALEALFVDMYHPMADAIAVEALRLIRVSLPIAFADGNNIRARADMQVASAMAAVSFQKGLGAVHGISEPMGAVYDLHHGLTNAILLPFVLRDLGPVVEDKCRHVAASLDLPTAATGLSAVVDWVERLNADMGIPSRLSQIAPSMSEEDIESMATKAADNPTGFTNAIRWDAADYARVIRAAL